MKNIGMCQFKMSSEDVAQNNLMTDFKQMMLRCKYQIDMSFLIPRANCKTGIDFVEDLKRKLRPIFFNTGELEGIQVLNKEQTIIATMLLEVCGIQTQTDKHTSFRKQWI